MNIKKNLIKVLIIFAVLFVFGTSVYAEKKETVKVGWFPLEGFQEVDEDGNCSGYNYEYLKKIEQFSGIEFEFVEGDWSEFMELVQSGDIDMMGNISMTDVRLAKYKYSRLPMGESHTVLLTRQDDERFAYDDLAVLDGTSICFGTGDYKLDEIKKLEKEYGFKSNHIIGDNNTEIQNKLINKECDVAVLSSSGEFSGFRVIGEYNPHFTYYITAPENTELMKQIDYAMNKIKLCEPSFSYYLMEKYQKNSNIIAYTKEEEAYLKKLEKVKVGIPKDSLVLSLYNEESNSFTGVIYDLLEDIAERTGIEFEYIPIEEGKDKLRGLKNGDYQVVTDIERTTANLNSMDFMVTEGYLPSEITLVGLRNIEFDPMETLNINAYNIDQSTINSIKDRNPSWNIIIDEDDSPFDELNKKKVDLVICSGYLADYHMQMPRNTDLKKVNFDLNIKESCIAIDSSLDYMLLNIINKAMHDIDKDVSAKNVLKHSAMNKYELTTFDILSNHTILFLGIILIAIAFIAVSLKINNNRLKVARKAAEEANRAKSEFFSRISHDMRTPLVSVMGLADIGIDDKRDIKDVEYFKQIKKSSNYLLGILNDILDMQKTESEQIKLNTETCKLSEMFFQVLALTKPIADDKGIDLQMTKGKMNLQDYYKVDVMRLNQISINILSNAIKCTKGGGKIVWSNRIVEEENKVYLVQTIKDNGVGMSEEFQKVLFEPFTQEANPETKNELGTGLGLAITKNLISIMGGSIEFKSKLNKGTQFTITIPLEIATKEEIEQYKTINIKDKTEVDLSNKKILLCEDVEINARIIKKMLESKKLIVDLAENGKIGIDMAKKNKYDAIIMDIRMPIVDGIAATKEIRKFNKNIPIIALSANAYKEDIELSLEAGMNAHLSKPVNKDLLFKELCKYLGGENENN